MHAARGPGRVPGEGARGGPRDLATVAGTAFHAGADRSRLKPLLRSGCCRSPSRSNRTRAVGAAVGKNPISFVVPCHRVVGTSGALTGYHWGVPRKRAILGWEAGVISAAH